MATEWQRETGSQLSDLLQEAYKNLGAAHAIVERSRWFDSDSDEQGGDLNLKIYRDNPDVRRVLRQMGYLANSMSEFGDSSPVLDAARAADAIYNAADEALREIGQTHEGPAIA